MGASQNDAQWGLIQIINDSEKSPGVNI